MKQRWLFLLTFCALMLGTGLCASAEGIVGSVYDSNTKAYIDCNQVEVYTYQNLPYIVAEDLDKYGFDVSWNPDTQIVEIKYNEWKPFGAEEINHKIARGEKLADVYDSETRVRLDGDFVTAYSLSGRMLISLDELWRYGSVNWYAESNSISAMTNRAMQRIPQWETAVPTYLLTLDAYSCITQVTSIYNEMADYYNASRTTDAWTYYNRVHTLDRRYANDLYAIKGYLQEMQKQLEQKEAYMLQSDCWDMLSTAIEFSDSVIQVYDTINGHSDSYISQYAEIRRQHGQALLTSSEQKAEAILVTVYQTIA
jgi:hypothetical protein